MVQHIWTIACRLSITDKETNNVSLLQVLEEITIPQDQSRDKKLVPAIFELVTLWARADENQPTAGFGRLALLGPTGDVLLEHNYEIDLQQDNRIRSVGKIFGFPVQRSGRYHFRIERKLNEADPWQEVARIPIWVNNLRQEQNAEAG